MAFNDHDNTYGREYHSYPVYAQENSIEGSTKRFVPLPGPKEIYDYALFGLPKYLPLTKERILPEGLVGPDNKWSSRVSAADFLTSALVEIEMDMNCIISEDVKLHSEDYIDGMFTSNYQGMRLQYWPATAITQVKFKFPHTNTPNSNLFQSYTVPPEWVYLRRNKVNVIASLGSISIETTGSSITSARGFMNYITGFSFGAYQPGTTEIVYQCGFQSDKLPAVAADLVKTWAAHRYLIDLIPVLFPNSGVSVSIDGIQQSVNYNIQQMVTARIESLEKKKNELKSSLKKQFGRTIGFSFIGA